MKRLASTTFVDRNSSETRLSSNIMKKRKNIIDHEQQHEDEEEDIVLFKDLSIDRLMTNVGTFVMPYEHVVSSIVTSGLKEEKKCNGSLASATYKQRTREEQLQIVLDYLKEHPTRERGSLMVYSQKKHINKSQLTRYLKAYDLGQLTCGAKSSASNTIERGHPSALMNASQIEKVLQIIKAEQGNEEDFSNKRIGEIIYELIGKQPSAGYVSKFASTYLALNGPKRKKKKIDIKIETKIEVKSETN